MTCYRHFNLPMGSSPGFGSTPCDVRFANDEPSALFGLAFAAAPGVSPLASPQKVTRWVILQEARPYTVKSLAESHMVLGLLVGTRFQVLFHSPRRGAFHLSLTVLVHYRSPEVFSLSRWSGSLRTGLACPVLLRCSTPVALFSSTGLSPSAVRRSRPVRVTQPFLTGCLAAVESFNPPL
jgi:hypothetical protein